MVARSDESFKSNVKNLLGEKFNRLSVVGHSHVKAGTHYWNCVCDCGSQKIVRGSALTAGATKSCGCLQKEKAARNIVSANTIHGQASGRGTRTYRIWAGMIGRCTQPTHSRWAYYGGRGIGVCDRWRTFCGFFADVGEIPDGLTLDRVGNDGDYTPGNCRLATMKTQAANRRGPFKTRKPTPNETQDLRCNSSARGR